MAIIDVTRLEAKPREHSDNKQIVRRDDLKISLVSVRLGEEIPVHLHEGEGLLSLGDEVYQLHPGIAVVIPSQLPQAFRTPTLLPCGISTFLWPEALELCPTPGPWERR